MREIKFRAWHEGYPAGVDPQMVYDSTPGDCLRWKSEGQKIASIMQYTGLKDKNGKEIYEGDILYIGEGLRHQSVRWVEWMAGFAMAISETSGTTGIPKDCEVVGNIYEILEITT